MIRSTDMDRHMICGKCNIELQMKNLKFVFFDYELQKEVPCCPKCGQYYISKELAEGKMREAEMELEDK
jgi:predicted  nucleic acid-binding Zn-ribbon protein